MGRATFTKVVLGSCLKYANSTAPDRFTVVKKTNEYIILQHTIPRYLNRRVKVSRDKFNSLGLGFCK